VPSLKEIFAQSPYLIQYEGSQDIYLIEQVENSQILVCVLVYSPIHNKIGEAKCIRVSDSISPIHLTDCPLSDLECGSPFISISDPSNPNEISVFEILSDLDLKAQVGQEIYPPTLKIIFPDNLDTVYKWY
jgi:hypothetical protein